MAFLDWIKKRGKAPAAVEPKTKPSEHLDYTARGNLIIEQSRSEWRPGDDGVEDYRRLIGRSVEGFHGGLEARRSGRENRMMWSNRRPTMEAAEKAARRMREGDEYGFGPSDLRWQFMAEFEHDQKLAKLRDETGREPESGPVIVPPKPSRSEKRPLPKREKLRDHDILIEQRASVLGLPKGTCLYFLIFFQQTMLSGCDIRGMVVPDIGSTLGRQL